MKIKVLILHIILVLSIYILISPSYGFEAASSKIYEGIDISGWQGNINYSQVRDFGIEVVYMKSSEGYSFIDPYFEENYTNAKNNGLKVGFYHYVTAKTTAEAFEQAKFFSGVVKGKEPDCRLAMDFEDFDNLSRAEVNQIATTFMQTVEKLTGKEMVLYSNTYSARSIFSSSLTVYPLWVAQYGVTYPTPNGKWDSWIGWQYTSQGNVAGIRGNVDRDQFTEEIFLEDNSKIEINNQDIEQDKSNISSQTNNLNKITVKWGDTLSQIALDYNTTVLELATLNNIENPNLIYVGETIILPTKETNQEISNNGAKQEYANQNIAEQTSEENIYIVKNGDTLTKIANMYSTTVNAIAIENNIQNINLIYVGQKLRIPRVGTNYIMYKIQWGDTLWSISRKYGVSIATLVRINRIKNPNLIYAGRYLKV